MLISRIALHEHALQIFGADRRSPSGDLVAHCFSAWFKASKVVDELGMPLVYYHATDADFSEFKYSEDIGFHFGSRECANARAMQAELENAVVMPVYLSLQNPLRMRDLQTWGPNEVAGDLFDLGVISAEECDSVEIVDREQVAQWLAAKGFDSIVYANETEGGGDSFIAMHGAQIKSSLANCGQFDAMSSDITCSDALSHHRHNRQQHQRRDSDGLDDELAVRRALHAGELLKTAMKRGSSPAPCLPKG